MSDQVKLEHYAPVTDQQSFSAMRGHVVDGTRVRMFDGSDVFVAPAWLPDTWRVCNDEGIPLRSCRSAAELEHAVVNYDGEWT